jgi:hypothetical protein
MIIHLHIMLHCLKLIDAGGGGSCASNAQGSQK